MLQDLFLNFLYTLHVKFFQILTFLDISNNPILYISQGTLWLDRIHDMQTTPDSYDISLSLAITLYDHFT
jgi:hypothetical protein